MIPPELAASQILGIIVAIYIGWLLSKVYHQAKWTRQTLKKRLATYSNGYAQPAAKQERHPEHELTAPRQMPNCKIPEHWTHGLKRLDR